MTRIEAEIDERTLRQLVLGYLSTIIGVNLVEGDVSIEVKSKRNYKAEWEEASFRARVVRLKEIQ